MVYVTGYTFGNDPVVKFGQEVVNETKGFKEKDTSRHRLMGRPVANCTGCCIIGDRDGKLAVLLLAVLAAAASITAAICAASSTREAYVCQSYHGQAKAPIDQRYFHGTDKNMYVLHKDLVAARNEICETSASALRKKSVERGVAAVSQATMAVGLALLTVGLVMVLLEADALALPLALPGLGLAGGGGVLYLADEAAYLGARSSKKQRDPNDLGSFKTDHEWIEDRIAYLHVNKRELYQTQVYDHSVNPATVEQSAPPPPSVPGSGELLEDAASPESHLYPHLEGTYAYDPDSNSSGPPQLPVYTGDPQYAPSAPPFQQTIVYGDLYTGNYHFG